MIESGREITPEMAAWRSGETQKAADEKRPEVPRSELEDGIKNAMQTPEDYLKDQIAKDGEAAEIEKDKLQPV